MRRIHICHVVFSFDDIGGLENGLINIVNGMDTQQFHHTICSLTQCGRIQSRVTATNVTYIELNKKQGNDVILPFALAKIFKKQKIDIVHLRNWPTMVEGYLGAKLARIKHIIYSEHGRHFEEIAQGRYMKFRIKKYIFDHVSVLLTVSSEVKMEIKNLYRTRQTIRVILNGVDHNRFKSVSKNVMRKLYGFPPEQKILGTVSRLVHGKKLGELIDSFSTHRKDTILLIIGDGPERPSLEKLIRSKKISACVRLLGNREDIPQLLNSLDLFVLPSQSEGLSNVLIEAMACQLPVVAFDTGGNKELVEHGKGGYLVALNAMDQMMASVNALLNNTALSYTMGRHNRNKVEHKFSIETMVSSYSRLYLNLFNGQDLGL